ncbi:MAG: EutN/CcmL family microcompartment protein [Propionibacteriaceae bacterium]|jgi:ethanolamine utilization protein EutN|nr:EutN/CcmL family microcompartment protein [Propionibacteriaceae bacterium]
MYLAKVRGTVVSTQKDDSLVGFKLLVTQRVDAEGGYISDPQVSVDTVGAGVGETVIVTGGSSARMAAGRAIGGSESRDRFDGAVDSAIVGIVDTTEIDA